MSDAGSAWFGWMRPHSRQSNKEKRGRELREQIRRLSGSSVLDDAGVHDAQVLTLTREELNELFPGVQNFQLRRKIMALITEKVKDSIQPGPETFASALKNLMQNNNSGNAAVQDVLRECLQSFRAMEEQLKAAQASLKPYIEVLNSLNEACLNKAHRPVEAPPNSGHHPYYSQINSVPPNTHGSYVKVHSLVCGKTLGADRQILALLEGVTETDAEDSRVMLVFCPVTSRVGTDIEEALKRIPDNKAAVLVIMHHTYNPNYVGPRPNMSTLTLDHVSVLFHDTANGLLMCPANEAAICRIQSVLKCYT